MRNTSDNRKKIDKLDSIKIKNLCAESDTKKKVKRLPTEWEKLPANHLSYETWIQKHKELNNDNTNNSLEKWAKNLNRHFFKHDRNSQSTYKDMLDIMRHQINIKQNQWETSSHPLVITKKTRVGEDGRSLIHYWWEWKLVQQRHWKTACPFLKR